MIKFKLIYMKHLKLFSENQLRDAFLNSSDYIEPHVSYVLNGGGVSYNKPVLNNYIRLYVDGDGVKIKPLLSDKNLKLSEEDVLLQKGWNILDCDGEFRYTFTTLLQGNNSKLITEIDMTHFTGDVIGNKMLYRTSISSITIPRTVKTIFNQAFEDTNIQTVFVPNTLERITGTAFGRCPKLTEVVFESGSHAELGKGTFYHSPLLRRVVLPTNLVTLSRLLFSDCPSLSEVIIPTNLERIENDVFSMCTSLETLTLPATIKYISRSTNRSNLSLTILAKEPPTIERGWQFKEILVPREAVDTYKNATNGWEAYKNLIKPIEE